jgi:hypothetical protein
VWQEGARKIKLNLTKPVKRLLERVSKAPHKGFGPEKKSDGTTPRSHRLRAESLAVNRVHRKEPIRHRPATGVE